MSKCKHYEENRQDVDADITTNVDGKLHDFSVPYCSHENSQATKAFVEGQSRTERVLKCCGDPSKETCQLREADWITEFQAPQSL